jgi:hypothetical protein
VVEHSIGNGEVDSSILSGSTSPSGAKPGQIQQKSVLSSAAGLDRFSYFGPEQTSKACAKADGYFVRATGLAFRHRRINQGSVLDFLDRELVDVGRCVECLQ